MSIQKIADDIKALTIHPVATDEYSAGYQAARHDAWLIAEESAEKLSAQIVDLLAKAPPDFADKSRHVEWGGDAFVFLETLLSTPHTPTGE